MEAYFDKFVLSKVGVVCYCVYIAICVCVFVTLLAEGNKERYLSIYLSMIPLCNGFYLFPLSRAVNSNSLIFGPSEFKIGLYTKLFEAS